jgi:cyanuric acid amidohydrolase
LVNLAKVAALIGKIRGKSRRQGLTRGFATLLFGGAREATRHFSPDEVLKRIAFVWSGGTRGVLISHGIAGLRAGASSKSFQRLRTIHVRSADRFPGVRILRN